MTELEQLKLELIDLKRRGMDTKQRIPVIGNDQVRYPSMAAAARATGLSVTGVSRILATGKPSSNGIVFG